MMRTNVEFEKLLRELQSPDGEHIDWTSGLDRIDEHLADEFETSNEALDDLLASAPQWEYEIQKIKTGQKLLQSNLGEFRQTVSRAIPPEDVGAQVRRWISH